MTPHNLQTRAPPPTPQPSSTSSPVKKIVNTSHASEVPYVYAVLPFPIGCKTLYSCYKSLSVVSSYCFYNFRCTQHTHHFSFFLPHLNNDHKNFVGRTDSSCPCKIIWTLLTVLRSKRLSKRSLIDLFVLSPESEFSQTKSFSVASLMPDRNLLLWWQPF